MNPYDNSEKRATYDQEHINHTNLHDSIDNNEAEVETDNFIILWVFFSIFAIFIIIPVVYVLSSMSLFD